MLIDSHSHIYLEQFDDDRQEAIDNALNNGVQKIVLPNIDSLSIESMQKTKQTWPDIFEMALGLHPTSVNLEYKSELTKIFTDFYRDDYVAIGEIGIDLYWDLTYCQQQKDAFDYQLSLAQKHDLPVIIHSRNSFKEVIDVLKPHLNSGIKGVFHCFPGNYQEAKQVVDYGFYLGIGGVLTYKKSNMLEVVEQIPLEHIILETDSPYLSPVPKRGKRNEPAYVKYVADKISEITGKDFEHICNITSLNSKELFKL